MNDSYYETPAEFEDPRRFAHGTAHVVDVLKRHERDREIGRASCRERVLTDV